MRITTPKPHSKTDEIDNRIKEASTHHAVDPDAAKEDLKLLQEAFTLEPEELLARVLQEPSDDYPYSEVLGGTFSIKEAKTAYQRKAAETIVRAIMEGQDAEGLTEAIDAALSVDQYDLLEDATSDDYNEYDDVTIGNEARNIRLVGRGHMVRILAAKKSGKTTFCLEVIRSSITGEQAFGCFDVEPLNPDEKILFVDPELSSSDYQKYIRYAFSGMTREQMAQVVHLPTRLIPQFDLMSERTRDELIRVVVEHNITRIVFDSYVKLIPNGSVSKEDDVKRMLKNWSEIQAATSVRESFWVGHINNTGEIRSSGSMLFDGTFESLLAITRDTDGRRYFQADEGRMTDGMERRPYILDPDSKRPFILLDEIAPPLIDKSAEKRATNEAVREGTRNAIHQLALQIASELGEHPTSDGTLLYGGIDKNELSAEILNRWSKAVPMFPTPTPGQVNSGIETSELIFVDSIYWLSIEASAEKAGS